MKNFKVFAMVAMGLLVGTGLVFLIIRYMDKLTDLIQSVRKNGLLKLEFGAPRFARISENAAEEDCCQAFTAGFAAKTNSQGDPTPNTPTEE